MRSRALQHRRAEDSGEEKSDSAQFPVGGRIRPGAIRAELKTPAPTHKYPIPRPDPRQPLRVAFLFSQQSS